MKFAYKFELFMHKIWWSQNIFVILHRQQKQQLKNIQNYGNKKRFSD